MKQITVYEKPTCSKCREVNKMLMESNLDYNKINYYDHPFTAAKLHDLLQKMRISARELLRTNEPIYRTLGLSKANLNDKEIVELMVKHPDLIQRPIVEYGAKAVLGRPSENVKTLL